MALLELAESMSSAVFQNDGARLHSVLTAFVNDTLLEAFSRELSSPQTCSAILDAFPHPAYKQLLDAYFDYLKTD
ncbi:hypothetical protein HK100_003266, partial [Physocladia obscura]